MPPSVADSSRASSSASVSRSSVVVRLSVTCLARDPENPVLPSRTMSHTGSKARRPPHENLHNSRSGVPDRVMASKKEKLIRFNRPCGRITHRSYAPRQVGASIPVPGVLVLTQNGIRWQLPQTLG